MLNRLEPGQCHEAAVYPVGLGCFGAPIAQPRARLPDCYNVNHLARVRLSPACSTFNQHSVDINLFNFSPDVLNANITLRSILLHVMYNDPLSLSFPQLHTYVSIIRHSLFFPLVIFPFKFLCSPFYIPTPAREFFDQSPQKE